MSADVIVRFIGDAKDLLDAADQSAEALQEVGDSAGGEGSGPHGLLLAGGMALGVTAVVALGKALFDLGMAAGDEQLAADQLANKIRNLGQDTGDWQKRIEDVQAAGAAVGFDDGDVTAAIDSILGRTGDLDTALSATSAAFEITRSNAELDLASVATAVGMAADGSTRSLEKIVGAIPEGVDPIVAALDKTAGSAAIWAESTTGQAALVGKGFNDVGEAIGTAVLPALQDLLPAILPIVTAFGDLVSTVLPAVMPLLTTASQLIVTILGVFKDTIPVISDAFQQAQPWFQGVHDILQSLADKILPPLVVLVGQLWGAFQKIVSVMGNVIGVIASVIGKIGEIAAAIGNALHDLQEFLQKLNPLNGVSFSFDLPGWVPHSVGATSYVTINTGADPRAVVYAVRQWAGANGGMGALAEPGT